MKTILIVDSDLGFIFWLGQVLDSAGYEALPATSVQDAIALLDLLHLSISLLMLNASLPDAGYLIEALRKSQTHVRVIGISATEERGSILQGVDVWRSKPERIDERAKLEWLQLTDRVLSDNTDVKRSRFANLHRAR